MSALPGTSARQVPFTSKSMGAAVTADHTRMLQIDVGFPGERLHRAAVRTGQVVGASREHDSPTACRRYVCLDSDQESAPFQQDLILRAILAIVIK